MGHGMIHMLGREKAPGTKRGKSFERQPWSSLKATLKSHHPKNKNAGLFKCFLEFRAMAGW